MKRECGNDGEILPGHHVYRASGNYNRFWAERNYLNLADRIRASVFIVHGLNDWNVKTNQCIPLFRELKKRGVPAKMMLHQGPYVYIHNLRDSNMLDILHRWLEHYLKGADNGIDREPAVLVESGADQSVWMASETWPLAGCKEVKFPIPDRGRQTVVDDLSQTAYDRKADNLKDWRDELALNDNPEYRNRLKFVWNPFRKAPLKTDSFRQGLRISGTAKVSFDAAIDRETAILSTMLVDLRASRRITEEQIPHEDGTYSFGVEEEPSPYKVISRGWLNAQNRSCLWRKERIVPGEMYHYEIDTAHLQAWVPMGKMR